MIVNLWCKTSTQILINKFLILLLTKLNLKLNYFMWSLIITFKVSWLQLKKKFYRYIKYHEWKYSNLEQSWTGLKAFKRLFKKHTSDFKSAEKCYLTKTDATAFAEQNKYILLSSHEKNIADIFWVFLTFFETYFPRL